MKQSACLSMAFVAMLSLGACKSGGSGSEDPQIVDPGPVQPGPPPATGPVRPDPEPMPPVDPIDPGLPDDGLKGSLAGWFVKSFDMAKIREVREQLRYTRQDQPGYRYDLKTYPHLGDLTVRNSNPFREIGLDYAWSTGLSGKGAMISIVDSRIDPNHEAMAGKSIRLAPGASGFTNDHGTAVAGIAGGPFGVAPDAELHHVALDFTTTQSLSLLASQMRHARASGATISNNSWAYLTPIKDNLSGSFLDGRDGRDYVKALREFASSGVVVFAATNNWSDESSHLMAALPVLHPDLEKGWLAVINGIPRMDGEDVASATRISAACLEAARWCLAANGQVTVARTDGGPAYGRGAGASFAAPQVSGALALLSEAFPTLTPEQLRARLLVTADNGFFSHDGAVEFAPGLTHGYNSEWGHGFVDLKAALLPIGSTWMPTSSGGKAAMDEMMVVSGRAVGDAIATSLAQEDLVILDSMEGSFNLPGSAISAIAPDDHEGRVTMAETMGRRDPGAFRAAALGAVQGDTLTALHLPFSLSGTATHSIEDSLEIDLSRGETHKIAAITSGDNDGSFGLKASRFFEAGQGIFELGVEALRESGSIMGTRGMEANSGSQHYALNAGAAMQVSDNAMLRFESKLGRASGGSISDFAELDDLTFNSFGVSFSLAGARAESDVLTFYARQPVAVSSGSAEIVLARQTAAGVAFTPSRIDMSPSSRQLDIGMEYAFTAGKETDMAVAARWSDNYRNIAGETDLELGLSLSRRF